ncbi:MAG: undecaprenyl-diphosphatase UppP [Chloroflexota bacterium]|nr:undecaprenyl-diphosphatase UppP [Chloroflexota bacterium]
MDPVQALVLGLVQGLTEFIPVSSSAHLIIVPWLLGWPDPGLAFDAALHLGTLLAVLAFFARDWVVLARAFLASLLECSLGPDHNRLLAWLVLVGSIPGAIAGVLLDHTVEAFFHSPGSAHSASSLLVMAALILGLAAALWLAEAVARHSRSMETLGWRDAIVIGLAQAAALLPGVSRSGATITAGLFLGLDRTAAARVSFLLATPIVAGAGAKKVYDALKAGLSSGDQAAFALGLLAAAVSGYLCISFLLRYLQRNSTLPFVLYRVALAAVIAVMALTR